MLNNKVAKRVKAFIIAISMGVLAVYSPTAVIASGNDDTSTGKYTGVPVGDEWDDTDGNSIQAHGGGFLQEGDTYYWVGENKSHGSANFKSVSLYSSKDLLNWTNEGEILTAESNKADGAEYGLVDCKVERPKLVKNPDGTYVLWAHWEDATGYSSSQIMVATSKSVTGPYTFQGHWRPGAQDDAKYRNWRIVTGSSTKYISDKAYIENKSADLTEEEVADSSKFGYGSRDLTVYAEGDTAYLISAEDHEKMRIHELNNTFDDVKAGGVSYNLFEGEKREAPALVKVDNVYYIITSSQSGWYPNQAKYAYTTDISDPNGWSELKLIGNNSTFYSQPTNIMTIQGKNGNSYVYMGDRWNSKSLGSSNYVWLPLTINNSDHTMDMTYCPGWKLNVATGSIVMPETQLVSENKKVYAEAGKTVTPGKNDTYEAFELKPEYANDGKYDMDSFWNTATNRYYGQTKVPYTWTVDLGKVCDLSRVDISFATCNGSESYYAYNLKGSNDNVNWTTIADRTDNKQVAFTSDAVSGKYRYVQVEVTSVINDHNGNSTASWANGLIEVQVFAKNSAKEITELPNINVAGGTYFEDQTIEITAEAGADIYYTVDGSEPTTESIKYTKPFKIIKGNTTVKAIAVLSGKENSGVITLNYTILDPTDIVKIQDDQTLDFMVLSDNAGKYLPNTLKAVMANGKNNDSAKVEWSISDIDKEKVYETQQIKGIMDGGYEVTANVTVIPNDLVMFIDCGTTPAEQAKTASDIYTEINNILGDKLLNKVSDQEYNETDKWGYTGTVGNPNNSEANYGIHDGNNFKANGWWGKGDREMPYQIHLAAGKYDITSGHQEWWNATRNMTLKVTANGQEQTTAVKVDKNNLETTGKIHLELEEDSDVVISVYGNGAVLSWIAVQKEQENVEPEVPVLESIKLASQPTKTEYTVGEKFDNSGLKLIAEYSDGSEAEITEGYEISGYDMQTAGSQTVTVSYEGKTVDFTITVKTKAIEIGDDNEDKNIVPDTEKVTKNDSTKNEDLRNKTIHKKSGTSTNVKESKSVKTDDKNDLLFWFAILVCGLCGMAIVFDILKRKINRIE